MFATRTHPLAALLMATLRRWAVPREPVRESIDPDLLNVMAYRPAAARVRCMLTPPSGTVTHATGRAGKRRA